ncbi:hypothetical protein CORC01_01234 [Colletotrichum orchidophilum]|uniref:Uncharacterized protein n=1 Tax=Colletotrichum orchidophilum TaxID=1209926 RepID=A0A1G4BQA6_9PEZI|nr:uncharacterized protein CORC01_01234 [Colletotrichum orchidophilum]OHF03515.1 hypothetical protein CORC01_01234 [Colletotrichum orchidophilum]
MRPWPWALLVVILAALSAEGINSCSLPSLSVMVSIRVLRQKTHTIFSHFPSLATPGKKPYPAEERMRSLSRRRGPRRGLFSPRKMAKYRSRLTPPDHNAGF